MSFSPAARARLRQAVALIGLLLMAICFFWWQQLPAPEGPGVSANRNAPPPALVGLVVIDAGHGGQDSGAMRNGISEKDLTLDVALRIEGLARVRGFRTLLTRPNDTWISLPARAALANRENDCVFVSVHFDEGNRAVATGVQTFYANHSAPKTLAASWLSFLQPVHSEEANFEGQSLAGLVQEALVARTHAFDRGTRAEQFFVVANVRHPAVLVEGGFLSNNDDLARLRTEDYRQQLAAAITDGIAHYRDIVRERAQALARETDPR